MKILQLGKAYPPANLGGVEVTIKLITEGLRKKNVICDVLGVNDSYRTQIEDSDLGKVYREKRIMKAFSTLLSFHLIFRLKKILNRYDILHIHHPDPMSVFAAWLCQPKCKVVLHWHSDILKQKILLKLFKPLQTWILERADVIVATSPQYAEHSNDLKPYSHKTSIIPIGLDTTGLIYDEIRSSEIKTTYKDKTQVLEIGRLTYYKGYEYYIQAIDQKKDKKYYLIIIGKGDQEKALMSRIGKLNLGENVKLLGNVSDEERNAYLAACDIFVLSSIYKTEAFAIVQIEAMSMGKPIVSTIIPGSGVDWVNKNRVSGLTVPRMDSNALANAIEDIGSDPNLYSYLSVNGKERFNSYFTQEEMSNGLITIYKGLLGRS